MELDKHFAIDCSKGKGKGKVVPRYVAPRIFTSALDGGEFSASRPGRFTPREPLLPIG